MINRRELGELWDQLRGRKPHMPHFLNEIRLDGIRGIHELEVAFEYPVSVLAGINASGKSTVLFAAACAYKVPGAGAKDYVPSTLFPDYRPKTGERSDDRPKTSIEYEYKTPEGRRAMKWGRKKGWNRSYFGRKGASQPERNLYLRTLSNLSNPSEVRSVLQMSQLKQAPSEDTLTPMQIDLAQQMLPFNYKEVVRLSSGKKNLLFATQKGGASYSEFHMSAGERSILRLAREIAQLKNALVLIDEVDTGLHPWAQEILMLQLQRLALRNDLQIIVTSHSGIVLNSVPRQARIFLDRDQDDKIIVRESHRDVIQDVLYGRPGNAMNLLCEDDAAEGILNGIMDELSPRLDIRREQVLIRRNTGAQEFPNHAAAFKRFDLLENFGFVLDGDQKDGDVESKIRGRTGGWNGPILFLPGSSGPEAWIWDCLESNRGNLAKKLGVDPAALRDNMERQNRSYASASGSKAEIAKYKLKNFSEGIRHTASAVCRIVAREEVRREESEIQPLVNDLTNALQAWRSRAD